MRRVAALTMAASLFVAFAAMTTLASDSEPATRVAEIPGTGLAVRLPAHWRYWAAPVSTDPVVIASDVATDQTCTFEHAEGATSAEAAAREATDAVEGDRQLELLAAETLAVPAGDAARVSYRHGWAPDEPRFVFHEYYVTGPVGVASVICQGVDPPADDWRSIVDSLESLEAAVEPSAPFDPRVEVPDHGFSVDLDAEWLVRPWPGPGPIFGWSAEDDGSPAGSISVLRAVTAEGGPTNAECVIEDATGSPDLPDTASPAEWQAALVASAEPDPGRASIPEVTTVDLVSGTVVLAEWERWREMPATAWIFLDGERHILLLCRAEEPPADGWRSIADTFEFLPRSG